MLLRSLVSRCFAVLFALTALFAIPAHAQAPIPLNVTGMNQDVVYENANPTSVTAYFDTGAGGRNNWVANGVNGAVGLISGTVLSAAIDTVTGGHSTFNLSSFKENNALLLTDNNTIGTLTLSDPTALTSIAIAAASGNAGTRSTSTLTLNFAGGVTVKGISYNSFDWVSGNGASTDIFSNNLDRTIGDPGGVMSYPTPDSIPIDTVNHPNLFETDIDLTNINGTDYSHLALQGIDFNITNTDTAFKTTTGIFAVSGTTVVIPEPGSLSLVSVLLLPVVGMIYCRKDLKSIKTQSLDVAGRRETFRVA